MRTTAFWLSLLLIFTVPMEEIAVFPGLGTISRLVGFLALVFWGASLVVTGRLRKPHPFHLATYYFVFWNVVSYFWSADFDMTMVRLKTYSQLVALTLILWDLYTTPAALKAGLQAYVLGAYVAAGSITANYLVGRDTFSHSLYHRYSGAGFNANDLALVLVLGLPVAWHLAVSVVESGRMSHVLRIANYAYIPVALFTILLTASRTALFSTLPAFLFILRRFSRLNLATRFLILAALTGSLFVLRHQVPQSSYYRLGTTITSIEEGDLGGRSAIWRRGLELFRERPLMGVGSCAFKSTVGRPAHNAYVSVLVELGIIGFALFGLILAIVVRNAIHQLRWESGLWLTIILSWVIGASALGWEYRKQTWLFFSLVVASANLSVQKVESSKLAGLSQAPVGTIPPMSSPLTKASETSVSPTPWS